MTYAERTKVPVSKSKMDIEKLVKRYDAEAFGIMEIRGQTQVAFSINDRNILFKMPVENITDQQLRSMWRALLLTIRGKLESAERGIETFEEAFLANIVMPDGQTVADHTLPAISNRYETQSNIPLLGRG